MKFEEVENTVDTGKYSPGAIKNQRFACVENNSPQQTDPLLLLHLLLELAPQPPQPPQRQGSLARASQSAIATNNLRMPAKCKSDTCAHVLEIGS